MLERLALVYKFRIVWQPRVIREKGVGAFDFWLFGACMLVEVDGEQHTDGRMHGEVAAVAIERDARKTEAAVRAGWNVVRLHVWDEHEWEGVLAFALDFAALGASPTAHYTSTLTMNHGPPEDLFTL